MPFCAPLCCDARPLLVELCTCPSALCPPLTPRLTAPVAALASELIIETAFGSVDLMPVDASLPLASKAVETLPPSPRTLETTSEPCERILPAVSPPTRDATSALPLA